VYASEFLGEGGGERYVHSRCPQGAYLNSRRHFRTVKLQTNCAKFSDCEDTRDFNPQSRADGPADPESDTGHWSVAVTCCNTEVDCCKLIEYGVQCALVVEAVVRADISPFY